MSTQNASLEEIYATIPHRPPFLFVDEILSIDSESIVTQRLVIEDEPQFEGHYPGNPIMPGVLLSENVFQSGAIFLVKQLQDKGDSPNGMTPILSRIREAKFKRMVRPGDLITTEVKMLETLKQFHFMRGVIKKDGQMVMSIEFAIALIEEAE